MNRKEDPRLSDELFATRRSFLKGGAATLAGGAIGPSLAGRAVSALSSRRLQTEEVVDVTDPRFGAVGDGVSNDRAAFQSAIDFAIKRRRKLRIPSPPNFYRIDLDGEHNRLVVNGNLEIEGGGRDSTLIRYGIPSPDTSKSYAGIFIHNGSKFRISDLRIEEELHPREFEFVAMHFESGTRNHAVNIERLDVDGFTNIVYSPSGGVGDGKGELFITVRDCDFKPDLRYCVALWTVEYGHKRLHLYDSYFHDNKESHLIYCHPHNSVHVENCRFDGATSWAFHFQGSAVAGDPEYQRFVGCWFGPRNSRGIITQRREKTYTEVEVRNCVFEGRPAIQIRSDIVIDGCYFTTPLNPASGNNFVGAYGDEPWKARITNCIFAARANSNPAVDMRLPDIDVTIDNCQFYHQNSGTLIALGASSKNTFAISNSLFYTRPVSDAQAISFEISDGQVSVQRCRFIGRSTGDRGVFFFPAVEGGPGPEARLQLDDCLFSSISGGSLFHVRVDGASSWSERIFGSNNRIINLVTAKPLLTVDPAGSDVFGYLNPVSGRAPAPLSAGPTLVINSNFDRYDVAGSGDVTFIHWWYEDGLSDPLFTGVVTFASANGFTLVAGGNIDLGSATSKAIPAGAEVRLFYEPSTDTWTEVAS